MITLIIGIFIGAGVSTLIRNSITDRQKRHNSRANFPRIVTIGKFDKTFHKETLDPDQRGYYV